MWNVVSFYIHIPKANTEMNVAYKMYCLSPKKPQSQQADLDKRQILKRNKHCISRQTTSLEANERWQNKRRKRPHLASNIPQLGCLWPQKSQKWWSAVFRLFLEAKKIDVNRRNLTYSIKISVSFSTAQEIENSYFCPAEDNFTKAVISTQGNRTTYLELASWEVSIFSLSARKRKESCMHASLKCENERKERASLAMKKRRPGAR